MPVNHSLESCLIQFCREWKIGWDNGRLVGPELVLYGLDGILYTELTDQKDIWAITAKCVLQDVRNGQIEREIQNLLRIAGSHQIKVILLKGLGLARRYWPSACRRFSQDIDILLPEDSFVDFLRILSEEGFLLWQEHTRFGPQDIGQYLAQKGCDHHFPSIVSASGSLIPVEVHDLPFQVKKFSLSDSGMTDDFWARAVPSDFPGAYALSLYDNLIYLGIHYLHHFLKNMYEGVCTGQFHIQRKLSLLHDIMLILEKEKERFCFEEFRDLLISYNLYTEYQLIFWALSALYPDHLLFHPLSWRMDSPSGEEKETFYASMSSFLIRLPFGCVLKMTGWQLWNRYIEYLWSKPVLALPFSGFRKVMSLPHANLSVFSLWNDEGIRFSFIFSQPFLRFTSVENMFSGLSGFFCLNVYADQASPSACPPLSRWILDCSGQDGPLSASFPIKLTLLQDTALDMSEEGLIQLFCEGGESRINLFLPWKKICPNPPQRLAFSFQICLTDQDGCLQRKESTDNPIWHDIASYRRLWLVK